MKGEEKAAAEVVLEGGERVDFFAFLQTEKKMKKRLRRHLNVLFFRQREESQRDLFKSDRVTTVMKKKKASRSCHDQETKGQKKRRREVHQGNDSFAFLLPLG